MTNFNRNRKIYIASTWKNFVRVRSLAAKLREEGHEVFDFTDPHNRPEGMDHFAFDAVEWTRKPLDQIEWLDFLRYQATQRAFLRTTPKGRYRIYN